MQKFKDKITTFTIAHYILLFLVACICITIIAYTVIRRTHHTMNTDTQITTTHISNTACINRITRQIQQIWEYDPKSVPEKYWNIAMQYLNTRIHQTTYGICQDVAYVCRPGQIRRDCDPCAVPSARAYAQSIHISDTIKSNCDK